MSSIIKLAPYAYLAKRNGGSTMYDLVVLVPVDAYGDTDLSNVVPVKPSGSTRITIAYTSNSNSAAVPYRVKHWAIDSNGTYLDLEIKGDNSVNRSTIVSFADADTETATVSNQMQTLAPYLFSKMETVGSTRCLQISSIVLFDNGLGVQSESLAFALNGMVHGITPGNGNASADPHAFAINQNVTAALVPNVPFIFESTVAASTGKPPRKVKLRSTWVP